MIVRSDLSTAVIASNLRRVDKNGFVGTVDLYVPHWHLHFYGVHWRQRQSDGYQSVSFPPRVYVKADGDEGTRKVVGWGDDATAERWRVAALAAIHKLVDEGAAP